MEVFSGHDEFTFSIIRKDLFKLTNVCNACWFTIHLLGVVCPEDLKTFFVLLSKHFICPKCRRHLREFVQLNKVPSTFEESVFFHNVVNTRIEKPFFENSQGLKEYLEEFNGELFFEGKMNMTGVCYVILLCYEHEGEAFGKRIKGYLRMNHFKGETTEELFLEMCKIPFLDKEIFRKENLEKVFIELRNQDRKPFM